MKTLRSKQLHRKGAILNLPVVGEVQFSDECTIEVLEEFVEELVSYESLQLEVVEKQETPPPPPTIPTPPIPPTAKEETKVQPAKEETKKQETPPTPPPAKEELKKEDPKK